MSDDRLVKLLDGVVGIVEASSYESLCLWREYHEELGKTWVQNSAGLLETIGRLADMPVCLSLFTNVIDGQKILFFEATSQVVDDRLVDAWMATHLPIASKNKTNAMNFHNVLLRTQTSTAA